MPAWILGLTAGASAPYWTLKMDAPMLGMVEPEDRPRGGIIATADVIPAGDSRLLSGLSH